MVLHAQARAFEIKLHQPRGFAALMSAVVIGAALMAAAASASAFNFYARSSGLEASLKAESETLARSCADYGALAAAADPSYAGDEIVAVGGGQCAVGAITRAAGTVRFDAQGVYRQSYTNLHVVVDTASAAVVSLEEVPKF